MAGYFYWGLHYQPAIIPMCGFEIGHAVCDAGADIVLGCHTHILKGIEVYKGKVIFHCQGSFAVGRRRASPVGSPSQPVSQSRRWGFNPGGKSLDEMYQLKPDSEYPDVLHPDGKTSQNCQHPIQHLH